MPPGLRRAFMPPGPRATYRRPGYSHSARSKPRDPGNQPDSDLGAALSECWARNDPEKSVTPEPMLQASRSRDVAVRSLRDAFFFYVRHLDSFLVEIVLNAWKYIGIIFLSKKFFFAESMLSLAFPLNVSAGSQTDVGRATPQWNSRSTLNQTGRVQDRSRCQAALTAGNQASAMRDGRPVRTPCSGPETGEDPAALSRPHTNGATSSNRFWLQLLAAVTGGNQRLLVMDGGVLSAKGGWGLNLVLLPPPPELQSTMVFGGGSSVPGQLLHGGGNRAELEPGGENEATTGGAGRENETHGAPVNKVRRGVKHVTVGRLFAQDNG
ncbi:hypothetical protein Bbelb_168390 [Branchiostoma belcheri]|nr:hypothetical protein Bbelb_168390 [Branchiostoma belcheri]